MVPHVATYRLWAGMELNQLICLDLFSPPKQTGLQRRAEENEAIDECRL